MKTQIFYIVLAIGITIITGAGCKNINTNQTTFSDPQNISYLINGESVGFTNGKSEQQLPTRPITIKSSIFEINKTDVNGDGKEDAVVILTQDPGGSGTFYYAAVAVYSEFIGYVGSNAVLLGDRIAPQNVKVDSGIIEINYATRKLNDSFVTPPSVGVTKKLIYANGQLMEAASNPEAQQKIIQSLSNRFNTPTSTLAVNFEILTEKFAKGMVNFSNHGGAIWLAAKTPNGWELAFVGNGISSCEEINKYNVPKQFAPKCLDLQNNVVDRNDSYIAWEGAKKLIQNCNVKSVMQSHNLDISIELKNGTNLKSVEPKIDDIINISVDSQSNCGKIIMATE